MMLITLPFFMPLVQQLGVDPIWFGVLFLICMQLGLLTPPFGLLLFTMKGVAPPGITMNDVFRAAMPYVWFGLLVLLAGLRPRSPPGCRACSAVRRPWLSPPHGAGWTASMTGPSHARRSAEIPTADGRMDAFVTHPEEGGPFPAGRHPDGHLGPARGAVRRGAPRRDRRLSLHAAELLVPARQGALRIPRREGPDALAASTLPKAVQDEMHANDRHDRSPTAWRWRTSARCCKFSTATAGAQGAEGHDRLLPGRPAVACAAAEFPDEFRASASMHGTRLVNDDAGLAASSRRQDARRNLLRLCRAGSVAPPSTIETLAKLFKGRNRRALSRHRPSPAPMHGYALPDRDIFDKPAANRDWENIFAMFRRQLG